MCVDGKRSYLYDTLNNVDWLTVVGGWVKRCMHWGIHVTVIRHEVVTYVNMPFVRRTGEVAYASQLALAVQNSSDIADTTPVTYTLEYVAFPRPYGTSPCSLVSNTGGRRSILSSRLGFRAALHYLSIGNLLILLSSRLVILTVFLFACCRGGLIMSGVAY